MAYKTHQPALVATFALLILAAGASAQEPASTAAQKPTPSSDTVVSTVPPEPHPQKTLEDFGWLAGEWHGAWGPRLAFEAWTPSHTGVMLGSFQLSENGKTLVLELFTLTEDAGTLKLHIRHFTPSLVAWEKQDPVALNLQSADVKTAVFRNPGDGEPKAATFTRLDADTYVSRFELTPEKGEPHITQIVYHRQLPAPPSKRPKHKPKQQAP